MQLNNLPITKPSWVVLHPLTIRPPTLTVAFSGTRSSRGRVTGWLRVQHAQGFYFFDAIAKKHADVGEGFRRASVVLDSEWSPLK